ncbi:MULTISPECIES: hypothetical protein [unclassified Halorubrum]|uniref:hypothetical protein n=1 Tax=unclassified Halorubrum TaxID=2642239 RepID=UPI000B9814BB|nr:MULTISPECIES: hypothetical protein [unclassified Halorubrum]OYR38764.1 hypothetical protein DJ81_17225 [Halorubrum sp. Hd13]OYR48642.1 hypothetical protein DJ74_10225 [Halorubrum sp. Ea8]
MNEDARTGLVVLLVLASVGVGLAGTLAALGVGDPIADRDQVGEVSIAGTNVTASSDKSDTAVVTNVSETSDIELTEDGGDILITTRENDRFTRHERGRAVEIVRANRTVASYLETVENEELTVEPIRKLNSGEAQTATFTFDVEETNSTLSAGETVKIRNLTVEKSDDTVTVDREPSYVEDRAVVRIGRAGREDARYRAEIDLANETVVDITDMGEL